MEILVCLNGRFHVVVFGGPLHRFIGQPDAGDLAPVGADSGQRAGCRLEHLARLVDGRGQLDVDPLHRLHPAQHVAAEQAPVLPWPDPCAVARAHLEQTQRRQRLDCLAQRGSADRQLFDQLFLDRKRFADGVVAGHDAPAEKLQHLRDLGRPASGRTHGALSGDVRFFHFHLPLQLAPAKGPPCILVIGMTNLQRSQWYDYWFSFITPFIEMRGDGGAQARHPGPGQQTPCP